MRFVNMLALMLGLGASLLTGVVPVAAQVPPARVFGAVSVNGQPPPAGTVVEAFVGDRLCGSGMVRDLGAPIGVGFIVDVAADASVAGCGKDGSMVSFKVGGLDAAQQVTFQTGAFLQQDLTAQGVPASLPPATASPAPTPAAGTTPPPSATPSPPATPSPTPAASGSAAPGPSPAGSASPEPSPSPAVSGTAGVTPTPDGATPSPSATPVSTVLRPEDGDGGDGGLSGGAVAAIVIALLGALGLAGYLFLRNRGGPPA